MPIEVPKIDLRRLKQERDGIWAAAVKAYRNGEQWWLSNEEENSSSDNNSKFQIIDEWQSAITLYLKHREQVSITELLLQVFDYELGKIERRDQMRVANILTNLKWKKAGQKQHQGKRQVVWIPIPPTISVDIDEVQQPESQLEQEISIPTTPSVSNTESENISSESEIREREKKDGLHGVEVLSNFPKQPPQSNSKIATPWLTYPYQSKDIYTLKNRAKKAKQRLLDCLTKGELINLYAQGLISASEVNWLKNNLLSQTECDRLSQVEATVQTNLFKQKKHKELKAQTTKEIRRIGWGKKQGIKYIKEKYGASDRAQMSVEQLTEFRNYLRTISSPKDNEQN